MYEKYPVQYRWQYGWRHSCMGIKHTHTHTGGINAGQGQGRHPALVAGKRVSIHISDMHQNNVGKGSIGKPLSSEIKKCACVKKKWVEQLKKKTLKHLYIYGKTLIPKP